MELNLDALGPQSPSTTPNVPIDHTCRPDCSERPENHQCQVCGCLLAPPQFWNDPWRPYLLSSKAAASRPALGESSITDTLHRAQGLLTAHDFYRKDFPFAAEREAALAQLLQCRRTFPLSPQTYHSAVAFFDAVCASRRVRAPHLAGIAEVCLYLSIKANEHARKVSKQDAFQSKISSKLGRNAFSELEVRVAEFLNFRFRATTPLSIYNHLAAVGFISPTDLEVLQVPTSQALDFVDRIDRVCSFLVELSSRWYSFNQFPPTAVATACIQVVREDCGLSPSTPELDRLTNVSPDTAANCSAEIRRLLRFYRLQFTRCLDSILTRWIRPDLVVQAHQDSLMTFLSEFVPCHQLRRVERPKKKIQKFGSRKPQVAGASEARQESSALRQLSIVSAWNAFHDQIHLATVENTGMDRTSNDQAELIGSLKLFL